MGIVISGEPRFIEFSIVLCLEQMGEKLTLVGCDPVALKKKFPEHSCTHYDGFDDFDKFETIVHFADLGHPSKHVPELVAKTHCDTLICISPLAAHTKAYSDVPEVELLFGVGENDSRLASLQIIHLILPQIYDSRSGVNASKPSLVPKIFRGAYTQITTAFKPSVQANKVAEEIVNLAKNNVPSKHRLLRVFSSRQKYNKFYFAVTRLIDISFALVVIALLWWLLIIVWVLIKITSPGPGIFAQERVGIDGKRFICYKFRTIEDGTIQAGTHDVPPESRTFVGRILRKTKFDELPQVWNILKSEMHLIGPRPCLPVQTEVLAARKHYNILDSKGGITGLAQIRGIDMSNPMRLAELDAEYLDTRNLWQDLKIIFLTATGSGQGDKIKK